MKDWKTDIVEKLRKRAAKMPVDSHFASIRSLMKEFQVSQRTTEEVIRVLVDEHVLYHRSGLGYFIRGKSNSSSFRFRLYYPLWPSSSIQRFEKACMDYAQQKGFRFSSKPLEQNDKFFEGITADDSDALLILTPAEHISCRQLRNLEKLPVPFAFVGSEVGDFEVSMLCDDAYTAGAIAASHLIANGHKKLAVFFTEPHRYISDSRLKGFCDFSRLSGATVKVIETGVQSWNDGRKLAYRSLIRTLEQDGLDFTGLFLISSASNLQVYKAFADSGYSIPKDVSIIAHDDLPENDLLSPALDCIQTDMEGAAASCIEELRKVAAGEKEFFHMRLVPKLIIRESVAHRKK